MSPGRGTVFVFYMCWGHKHTFPFQRWDVPFLCFLFGRFRSPPSKLHATWSNRVDSLRVTMIRSPVLLAHGIFTLSFYPVKEKDLLLLLFWISGARKSLMPFTSPVQHNLVMLCIHPCIHPSRISSLWNISAYTVRGELEDNMNKRIISHL